MSRNYLEYETSNYLDLLSIGNISKDDFKVSTYELSVSSALGAFVVFKVFEIYGDELLSWMLDFCLVRFWNNKSNIIRSTSVDDCSVDDIVDECSDSSLAWYDDKVTSETTDGKSRIILV